MAIVKSGPEERVAPFCMPAAFAAWAPAETESCKRIKKNTTRKGWWILLGSNREPDLRTNSVTAHSPESLRSETITFQGVPEKRLERSAKAARVRSSPSGGR